MYLPNGFELTIQQINDKTMKLINDMFPCVNVNVYQSSNEREREREKERKRDRKREREMYTNMKHVH